ncbi:hypothetical protein FACS189493_1220 [Spirochaetia bacterium]|nr:hypothetical protein FACS189493_1220 [Spirochaetia bacterium]
MLFTKEYSNTRDSGEYTLARKGWKKAPFMVYFPYETVRMGQAVTPCLQKRQICVYLFTKLAKKAGITDTDLTFWGKIGFI